jgi:hypothetical protein
LKAGESPATLNTSLESLAILRRGAVEHGKMAAGRTLCPLCPQFMPATSGLLDESRGF